MLGFELYLKNKDIGDVPKNLKPFKKIFFNKSRIYIDKRSKDEFGKMESKKHLILQNFLSMPLNFSRDEKKINLPDKRTGANSPNPYLELYGSFSISRKKDKILTLVVGKGDCAYKATYDIVLDKPTFDLSSDVLLKLDRKNYKIGSSLLYDSYVKSGIIRQDGIFPSSNFKKICSVFFDYVRTRKDLLEEQNPIKPINFSLFVLPSEDQIEFISEQSGSGNFVDSFGNEASSFANTPTRTAKFLSYDDPAFTLNLTKEEEFYRNIGIGNKSIEKINLPVDVFNIAGLSWIFTDITEPESGFEQTSSGVFTQLYKNYKKMKQDTDELKSQMKIICYKKNQAKIELLIDENMTMNRMNKVFDSLKDTEIPPVSFEILIDSTKNTTLWSEYLKAVRCLITGIGFDRRFFILYLTNKMRKSIHPWLSNKRKEGKEYFARTSFCLKVLSTTVDSNELMLPAENYAYNIGLIAGRYVKFRERSDRNNSLRDILTYNKYDREKLRFVYHKIGQGINLLKEKKESIDEISKYVKEKTPSGEIDDASAFDDFSYFFYKGVFENLGEN